MTATDNATATATANFVMNGSAEADCATGMQPGMAMTIDNNGDLSQYINGNDGAAIFGITLNRNAGIYDYIVMVDGQGPRGFGSGSIYLYFTDQTGDTYSLQLYSSRREVHTVAFNSDAPAIVKVTWSS